MATIFPKPKQSKAQVFGSPSKKEKNKNTPAGYHSEPDLCLPTSRANTTFVHH